MTLSEVRKRIRWLLRNKSHRRLPLMLYYEYLCEAEAFQRAFTVNATAPSHLLASPFNKTAAVCRLNISSQSIYTTSTYLWLDGAPRFVGYKHTTRPTDAWFNPTNLCTIKPLGIEITYQASLAARVVSSHACTVLSVKYIEHMSLHKAILCLPGLLAKCIQYDSIWNEFRRTIPTRG